MPAKSGRRFLAYSTRNREERMPRKPGQNSEFVTFDVVYEDGTRRSNRKVPRALDRRHRRRQAGVRFPDRTRPRHRGKIGETAGKNQEYHAIGRKEDGRPNLEGGLLKLAA